MISLGAAVQALAPLHTSIGSPSHVAHCPAYFVHATHTQWTGLSYTSAFERLRAPHRLRKPHAWAEVVGLYLFVGLRLDRPGSNRPEGATPTSSTTMVGAPRLRRLPRASLPPEHHALSAYPPPQRHIFYLPPMKINLHCRLDAPALAPLLGLWGGKGRWQRWTEMSSTNGNDFEKSN